MINLVFPSEDSMWGTKQLYCSFIILMTWSCLQAGEINFPHNEYIYCRSTAIIGCLWIRLPYLCRPIIFVCIAYSSLQWDPESLLIVVLVHYFSEKKNRKGVEPWYLLFWLGSKCGAFLLWMMWYIIHQLHRFLDWHSTQCQLEVSVQSLTANINYLPSFPSPSLPKNLLRLGLHFGAAFKICLRINYGMFTSVAGALFILIYWF